MKTVFLPSIIFNLHCLWFGKNWEAYVKNPEFRDIFLLLWQYNKYEKRVWQSYDIHMKFNSVFNHLSLYSFELTFRSCLASRKPSVEWKNAIMIHAHKMELTKYWKTSNILTY